MEERIDKIISFLKEIEKFKNVEREVYLSETRKENDAEHSWHMAMFIMLFEKDLPKELDIKKMLKIALMHDLVEIYAGDTFAFDAEGKADKKEREKEAAKKLFSQLPADLHKEFLELFQEFEAQQTRESKITKSFDQLQPILQNICAKGEGWKKHNLTFEQVNEYKRKNMQHDPLMLEVYERLMKEALDKGLL